VTIRRATKADQEVLRELWEEFEAELGGPAYLLETWEEAWTDLAETIKSGLALLAEAEGKPYTHLKRRRTYPGFFPVLHLDHIYFEGNIEVRRIELPRTRLAMVASDHLPLVADIRVRI
jgi:endonuclease/exonuclease/phosphatase family metal-dependent hydrolase